MDKSTIRKKALSIRKIIYDKEEKELRVLQKLSELDLFKSANTIFSYSSFRDELSTLEINNFILKQNKTLALPRVYGESMKFHKITSIKNDLISGYFGILEPKTTLQIIDNCDIVLVPALAFSKGKYRVGYGKGFYDKFLADKDCIKIGLCFDEQVFDEITHDDFDVKMDLIVTPTKIF